MYGKAHGFKIGLIIHQGLALRPFLFVIVIEILQHKATEGIWELLYAKDLLIVAKPEKDLLESSLNGRTVRKEED